MREGSRTRDDYFWHTAACQKWLDRPCKHLAGNVPLNLIDNSLGFQAVEDYLERIELAAYQ
ncbi:MbcA/ParS/Xre antitoxin family protein [Rhodococcus sp. IEGM1300]